MRSFTGENSLDGRREEAGASGRASCGTRAGWRAFTLVELLVVIGVIAVLISILIPTISRAQASAQRVACMSNLRQVGTMVQVYANNYSDRMPLGWWSGSQYWASYVISVHTNATGVVFPLWGKLYVSGLIQTQPRVWYCPTQKDDRFRFDTTRNRWHPTESDARAALRATDPSSGFMRAGYSLRPTPQGRWSSDKPDISIAGFPRVSQLGRNALVSDIVGVPGWNAATTGHPGGVNVLFADRSVLTVPTQVWKNYVDQTAAGATSQSNYLTFDSAGVSHGMWGAFVKW